MIHQIWFIMVAGSILFAFSRGRTGILVEAALTGCEKAVAVSMQLCCGYLFFCGLMEIVRALHAERCIQHLIDPILKRLLPGIKKKETSEAVTMNLSMNILGLGNAATPAGLEAMKHLEAERQLDPSVSHDMNMLLILNATGLQLLPSTVLAMRTAAGSADVGAVLIPTILCTACSTVVGAVFGLLCRRWEGKKLGQ